MAKEIQVYIFLKITAAMIRWLRLFPVAEALEAPENYRRPFCALPFRSLSAFSAP